MACAESLRQEGFGGRIVMFTGEPHLPYYRVMCSKNLGAKPEDLWLQQPDFFKEKHIEVLSGTVVTRLDTNQKVAHYQDAGGLPATLEYDKVLVASGGRPRELFVPGAKLNGVFTLRTPEDAAGIAEFTKTKGINKVVVVGGSFIGMEIASTLAKRGCEVAVVAMETVPFERVLGKKVGASFARLLQREGVEWYGSAQVRLFRGTGRVEGVELEDGEVLPADCIVVGAGVLPNTRFVEGATIDKNGGLIVGPLLAADRKETTPTLFAAGDVCTFPSAVTGGLVRIEHWDLATQQGRTAARNMLGQFAPFTAQPFFWSELFGLHLRFVGFAPEMLERVIIEGDVAGMKFLAYYCESDEIRAVASVNMDQEIFACAELMLLKQMPKVSEILMGTVNGGVIIQRAKDLSSSPS